MWQDGAKAPKRLPVREATVSLPITPFTSGSYSYHLELRDDGGRYFVRIPAGDRSYRIEVVAGGGPTIVSGPGDEDAVYGERIPVSISIAEPQTIRSVKLFHRVRATKEWSETRMELDAGASRHGTWRTMLSRPLGEGVVIEYHVVVEDGAGRLTSYGSPVKPYRLRVLAPPAPVDVGQ